jgi:hypothetical protein
MVFYYTTFATSVRDFSRTYRFFHLVWTLEGAFLAMPEGVIGGFAQTCIKPYEVECCER